MWFIQDTPLGTMTQEDRELYKRTLDEALDSGTVGQTKEWKNPASGQLRQREGGEGFLPARRNPAGA